MRTVHVTRASDERDVYKECYVFVSGRFLLVRKESDNAVVAAYPEHNVDVVKVLDS
jgi:hypothetical protein